MYDKSADVAGCRGVRYTYVGDRQNIHFWSVARTSIAFVRIWEGGRENVRLLIASERKKRTSISGGRLHYIFASFYGPRPTSLCPERHNKAICVIQEVCLTLNMGI